MGALGALGEGRALMVRQEKNHYIVFVHLTPRSQPISHHQLSSHLRTQDQDRILRNSFDGPVLPCDSRARAFNTGFPDWTVVVEGNSLKQTLEDRGD